MAKRNMVSKLIPKNCITEELRFVKESKGTYITPTGKLYVDYGNGMMFPLKTFVNKHNGYLYVGFKGATGKMIQRRVHVLVAKAYLPNPNNYPCVCHKDDKKDNPTLENLEWGTVSYNTKCAFDRGLAKNDSSWDDSQSKPVMCFNLDGTLYCKYGSVGEATRATGVTKSGILYQCDGKMKTKPRKGFIFRYANNFVL